MSNNLIQPLFERYYRAGVQSQDMSSHWQEYSSRFKVQIDADGCLTTLEGAGFGEMQQRSVLRRLVQELSIVSHLAHLPQRRRLMSLRPLLDRTCRAMGLAVSLDGFRQLCTLDLLMQPVAATTLHRPLRVLIIGDGFGVLSCLVKSEFPDASIVLVDLGQTLLFQASYCPKAHPDRRHVLAGTPGADEADFVYCPSDTLDAIDHRRFDIAINVASMQEMDPSTVAAYFVFLRAHLEAANLFYCCNRQSKTLPDGQVSAIDAYPWSPQDRVLESGLCPWHQYFLTAGVAAHGPRMLGLPVPGISCYDGPHDHRLVQLHTESLS